MLNLNKVFELNLRQYYNKFKLLLLTSEAIITEKCELAQCRIIVNDHNKVKVQYKYISDMYKIPNVIAVPVTVNVPITYNG